MSVPFAPKLTWAMGMVWFHRYWSVGIEDVEEFKRRWDQFLASGNRDLDIQAFDSAIDLAGVASIR